MRRQSIDIVPRLFASLFTRGSSAGPSHGMSCWDGGGLAHARAMTAPAAARLDSDTSSQINSLEAWTRKQFPPLTMQRGVDLGLAKPSARRSSRKTFIPEFPGLTDVLLSDATASDLAAEHGLSPGAMQAMRHAVHNGNAPADPAMLAYRLRDLSELQKQFPGLSLDAQLLGDAGVLAYTGTQLRSAMRVFMDAAPRHLPPVGQLMPRLGSWIARSALGTAAKLHAMDEACKVFLGMPFPLGALTRSNSALLGLHDGQVAEAAFALSVVLGKDCGRAALEADIRILGLAPAQIERACHALRVQLHVPDEHFSKIQQLVAGTPAILHMRLDVIRNRLDLLARHSGLDVSGRRSLVFQRPEFITQPQDKSFIALAAAEVSAARMARAAAKAAKAKASELEVAQAAEA